MFNKVILAGNLTKDIELRYSNSGSAIGNTSIAVSHKYVNQQGQKAEETCFIDITFFGKLAEIANQYLSKGSKLLVEGRLRFEQWSDNNGQNRSKHSVLVENMEMLGGNNNAKQNNQYNTNGSVSNQRQQNTGHSKNDYSDEVDFDDNDFNSEIPF